MDGWIEILNISDKQQLREGYCTVVIDERSHV